MHTVLPTRRRTPFALPSAPRAAAPSSCARLTSWRWRSDRPPSRRGSFSSLDLHEPDLIGQAMRHDRIAVRRDIHVAHNVAASRNGPALELLGLRIEAHHGVRLGSGFAVPER